MTPLTTPASAAIEPDTFEPGAWRQVAWRRVALFYGIAFGGAVVVSLLLWGLRQVGGSAATVVVQVATALLYMPLPLVAGLIVERQARRRPLLAAEWQQLRGRFWRTFGRSAGYALAVMVGVLVLGFAVAWLAGLAGLPGAGHLVADEGEFLERIGQLAPGAGIDPALPPLWIVVTAILAQGLLAGITINGLFAFGEEYGWRGVLAHELRPLGVLRLNLLTGVLWGLWHTPIIILGHNYGAEWGWGILLMVLWTTPLSFLLSWVRQRSGSVLAPALLHGAYNGTIGVFALLIVGGHLLVALPMGVLVVLVLSIAAIALFLPASARIVRSDQIGR